jgi:hypothetical protein
MNGPQKRRHIPGTAARLVVTDYDTTLISNRKAMEKALPIVCGGPISLGSLHIRDMPEEVLRQVNFIAHSRFGDLQEPNVPMIQTLVRAGEGADIAIVSARPESDRSELVDMTARHGIPYDMIILRAKGEEHIPIPQWKFSKISMLGLSLRTALDMYDDSTETLEFLMKMIPRSAGHLVTNTGIELFLRAGNTET